MEIITHNIKDSRIAEVASDEIIISTIENGLNLLVNLYYQDFDKIIIHEKSITPDFFDLKNGIAGEVLQKFSNHRVRLAIVGEFTKYTGKSITDFMYESNKGKQVVFVRTIEDALDRLT